LVKRKGRDHIDMTNSRCPNLVKVTLRKASQSSPRSPCSNVPLRCPLCIKTDAAIWKYNLQSHLIQVHQCTDLSIYEPLYMISNDETTLMRAVYLTKPRRTHKRAPVKLLAVSDAHSTRLTLRFVYNEVRISLADSRAPDPQVC
jgi:hypothetical protein